MNKNISITDLYKELENHLSTSSAEKRKVWATLIVENNFDQIHLSKLLHSERKIALRFSWLLSEIGELDSNKLLNNLPYLLKQSEEIEHFSFIESFATYWLISGIPLENEPKAIDLLFGWIISKHINVTTKLRALKVLVNLTEKYPELKTELKFCIESQIVTGQNSFTKSAKKIMNLATQEGW